MNRSEPDYYEILQVSSNASREIIEAAYRRLAQKYHPDVNKDANATGMMVLINEAFETLSNPARRAEYDARKSSETGGWHPGSQTGYSPKPPVSTRRPFPFRQKLALSVIAGALLAVIILMGTVALSWSSKSSRTGPMPIFEPIEARYSGNEFSSLPLAGYQTYTDAENGFSISIPEGWEKVPMSGLITVAFYGPVEASFSPNTNVVKEVLPSPMTAQDYVKAGETSLKILTGYQSLSLSPLMVNGLPAMKQTYLLQTPEPQKIKVWVDQVSIIKDSTAYVITCDAAESVSDKYSTLCNNIVESFQLTK
ncbi:MAG: DnaJ domain-containing protein [Chloroflexi bacterium]|nr:DnaJ domain-containing protein [Chloroflexota bacterium]